MNQRHAVEMLLQVGHQRTKRSHGRDIANRLTGCREEGLARRRHGGRRPGACDVLCGPHVWNSIEHTFASQRAPRGFRKIFLNLAHA